MESTSPQGVAKGRLVVLSDLHLGEGCDTLGRFSPMEDFYYDHPFRRFLDYLRAEHQHEPNQLTLVLNGDVFDFLTVTKIPESGEEHPFTVVSSERSFGLNPTPSKSVFKIRQILRGHRVFFTALAQFIAAGHRVAIVRGNHDLELYFEEVQVEIQSHLRSLPGGPSAQDLSERLSFHQMFYFEPGIAYVEHGNQYEASNSIRYPLRPVRDRRRKRREDGEPILDYPLGSYFVRYFYNSVHRMYPFTPRLISVEQYLDLLKRYNLLNLIRVARQHLPHFVQALRPQAPAGSSKTTSTANARQRKDLERLELTTSPPGLYHFINGLKILPLSASKLALVKEMTKPLLRRVAWLVGISVSSLYLWLVVFNLIQSPWLTQNVFSKAILLSLFTLCTMIGLLWLGSYLSHRMGNGKLDETVQICAQRADQIARHLDVKAVVMGHTHMADLRSIADNGATYANCGSWTASDNPWDMILPNVWRFPFVDVGDEGVSLLRWNDDACRVEPLPLFEFGLGAEQQPAAMTPEAAAMFAPQPPLPRAAASPQVRHSKRQNPITP